MKKPERRVLGYICGIDYQHELGECDITIYATLESLKKKTKCWKECGIVELGVNDGEGWKPIWVRQATPFTSGKKRQSDTNKTVRKNRRKAVRKSR